MTKSELVAHVARNFPYLSLQDAATIVETIFGSMADAVAQGDGVEIRGFGSLKVKDRRAREGRNPKTGECVQVSAKKLPHFKVGKELYERLNGAVTSEGKLECEEGTG